MFTAGLLFTFSPAWAEADREISNDKQEKDPAPNREGRRGDGDVRKDREEPRKEGQEPRRKGEGDRTERQAQRKGAREQARDERQLDRAMVRSRPLNAMLYKVQSPRVLLVGVGDAGKEMLLPLEPDTKIFLSGQPATLADLKPDMMLSIQQEGGLTRRIDARPPRVRGPADGGRKAGPGDEGKAERKVPAEKDPR